ncbi:MAG: putative porin [Candidatus Binatia bacterium]
MRRVGVLFLSGLALVGLGVSPGLAQKRSVAEEILEILRAENKISEQKYQDLMNRAKAENEAREAGVEAYRRDPIKTIKDDKGLSWLSRFSFSGDVRTRMEGFYQDRVNARTRERIRFRFGGKLKISDELSAGFRLVTGTANDPISTNQSLTGLSSRKSFNLDQAYITVTPKETFGLADYGWDPIVITAGKFSNQFFTPKAGMESELIYDGDLSPEGLHETFTLFKGSQGLLREFSINAAQWILSEKSAAADAWMFGGQAVAKFQLMPPLALTASFGDFYFSKSDLLAQERNSNSDLAVTNCVVLRDGTINRGGRSISPGSGDKAFKDFCGGFNIINAGLQLDYDTGYPKWPLALMFDFAHNTDAKTSDDVAVWAGISLGKTSKPGDWAFAVAWARTETDAVLSEFSYSDFGRGGTNVQGPFVKIDYLLLPNLTITAKNHFVSFIDRPAGQVNSTLNRFQLDAQLKF